MVDMILVDAIGKRASDIHVEPAGDHYAVKFRIDGLLETAARFEPAAGQALVARLMVAAHLLTYRLDIPQEGRLTFTHEGNVLELRLAVMPTTHGLRCAVRMPADQIQPTELASLGLPENVLQSLDRFSRADAGMLILTGPAGSGKTTTIYALLRHILVTQAGISIVALEDPVERDLPGITQIEVSPFGQMTYERALRSILRQDPQVLMLGEIRDAATASLAIQAALSGHRLITTLHAATPGGAIARLLEMGLEPYQITSSIFGVVAQRLARRLAPTGKYLGRVPVAEFVSIDAGLRKAILERADADSLAKVYASQEEYRSFAQAARELVAAGATDWAELRRALGAGIEES